MTDPSPFAELPAALVDEVLARTSEVAGALLASFGQVKTQRAELRSRLEASALLLRKLTSVRRRIPLHVPPTAPTPSNAC